MPTLYPGTNTYPTDIALPDDGDPANSAILAAPSAELADRTTWLKVGVDNLNAVCVYGVVQCSSASLPSGAHTWATVGTNNPGTTGAWVNPDGATPGVPGTPYYATSPTSITGLEAGDIVDVEFSFAGVAAHPGGGAAHNLYLGLTLLENGGSYVLPTSGYASWEIPSGAATFPITGILRVRHVMTSTASLTVQVQAYCSVVGGLTLALTTDDIGSVTVYRARP